MKLRTKQDLYLRSRATPLELPPEPEWLEKVLSGGFNHDIEPGAWRGPDKPSGPIVLLESREAFLAKMQQLANSGDK